MSSRKLDLAGATHGLGMLDPDVAADLDGGETIIRVRVPSRADRLRLVRTLVSEAAFANGCSDRCARDMVIAVDEACQNVIRHAYAGAPDGEISLEIRRSGDRLVFSLVDFGAPVDVDAVKPRALDEVRPGGLGTHFITECMDEAGFCPPPAGAGNCLWMAKKIE